MVKNLLSNAVKYSPRGGQVCVSAGPAEGHPGMIELAVEDDGVGIPAEQLPRIFEKYVRIPHPDTATARGLGLGLSLVKALAEAHGGRVEVDSLPGKGSRFRLLLPRGARDF
jgi:two-component system phosphate regulon sensor histidine kinase PhoR